MISAGQKADNWFLRQSPQVMGLQFLDGLGRADRDNAIDIYIGLMEPPGCAMYFTPLLRARSTLSENGKNASEGKKRKADGADGTKFHPPRCGL